MKRQTQLRAIDVMTSSMITLGCDAPIHEAAAVLIDNGISGAPVRDEFGRIVGMISLRDIARFERERPHLEASGERYDSAPEGKRMHLRRGFQLQAEETAYIQDFMTPIVISVPQDASLRLVTQAMLERRVHRVLVHDPEGEIVGIISALDLLRSQYEAD